LKGWVKEKMFNIPKPMFKREMRQEAEQKVAG
jgi:hypothetical protein